MVVVVVLGGTDTLLVCTAVGFGDISPKNGLSQAAVAIMILAAMVLIPTQVSKLSSLLSQRSVYDGTYRAIAGGRGHVLLAGDAPAYVVAHFLHEVCNGWEWWWWWLGWLVLTVHPPSPFVGSSFATPLKRWSFWAAMSQTTT